MVCSCDDMWHTHSKPQFCAIFNIMRKILTLSCVPDVKKKQKKNQDTKLYVQNNLNLFYSNGEGLHQHISSGYPFVV